MRQFGAQKVLRGYSVEAAYFVGWCGPPRRDFLKKKDDSGWIRSRPRCCDGREQTPPSSVCSPRWNRNRWPRTGWAIRCLAHIGGAGLTAARKRMAIRNGRGAQRLQDPQRVERPGSFPAVAAQPSAKGSTRTESRVCRRSGKAMRASAAVLGRRAFRFCPAPCRKSADELAFHKDKPKHYIARS